MGTVVPRRFAKVKDKSGGESEAIDIGRKAPKARQWKYGDKETARKIVPALSLSSSLFRGALFSLEGAMNGSFYELRAHLFRPSTNIGRSLFLFLLPFRHTIHPREPLREREFPAFSCRLSFISLRKDRLFAPVNFRSVHGRIVIL